MNIRRWMSWIHIVLVMVDVYTLSPIVMLDQRILFWHFNRLNCMVKIFFRCWGLEIIDLIWLISSKIRGTRSAILHLLVEFNFFKAYRVQEFLNPNPVCRFWLCKMSNNEIFQHNSVIATDERNLVLILCFQWVVDIFKHLMLIS